MTQPLQPSTGGASRRSVEIVTALAFAGVGLVGLWDATRLGAGWGADGPQSGYFPFWIALIMTAASIVTLAGIRRDVEAGETFVTREQLGLVLSVLIPATAFVLAIGALGLYGPAALLIAWFMTRLGGFRWPTGLITGGAVAAFAFVTFEIWFLVPLPKGPVEAWLGY